VCNELSAEENRSLEIIISKYVGKKTETEVAELIRSSVKSEYSDSEFCTSCAGLRRRIFFGPFRGTSPRA
jgi:hypothetical protein